MNEEKCLDKPRSSHGMNRSHILDIPMESQVILALLREVWVSEEVAAEEVAAEKERCLWKRMSFFTFLHNTGWPRMTYLPWHL